MPVVRLIEVDGTNWLDLAAVTPRADQVDFVAPITYYLCLAHFGDDWKPLAIEVDGRIVGHVMWAVDPPDGSTWLGGLVIDAASQGKGIGRATVNEFVNRFTVDGSANIALSYHPGNTQARALYLDIGFVETGETAEDEIVARYVT